MSAYVRICRVIVNLVDVKLMSVDTTFMRRNGIRRTFVKREYDQLLKRGALGQVVAIAFAHIGGVVLPIGFKMVDCKRTSAVIKLLEELGWRIEKITLLVDGGLMSRELVRWVKSEREGWTLIGLIRRNMKVGRRKREGGVDEIVGKEEGKGKVVYVKR